MFSAKLTEACLFAWRRCHHGTPRRRRSICAIVDMVVIVEASPRPLKHALLNGRGGRRRPGMADRPSP